MDDPLWYLELATLLFACARASHWSGLGCEAVLTASLAHLPSQFATHLAFQATCVWHVCSPTCFARAVGVMVTHRRMVEICYLDVVYVAVHTCID